MHVRRLPIVFVFALTAIGCQNRSASKPEIKTFAEFAALERDGATGTTELVSAECTDAKLEDLSDLSGLSCKDLRREFRYVVYVGKQVYCYWDMKKAETGTDYDQLATQLEGKITNKITLQQYFRDVLRPWAASLHDGHVNAMPGDDLSKFDLVTTNLKLRVLSPGTEAEKVVVLSSKVPQVPVKSQILKINGEAVTDVLNRYEALASGSTKAMRRLSAGAALLDKIGTESITEALTIEFQKAGAKPEEAAVQTLQLDRVLELNLPPRPGEPSGAPAKEQTGENLVQARILADQIGYLKIDGFVGSKLPDIFDRLMAQLKTTKALILDLRANGGGDLSGDRILRWLSNRDIVRYQISPKNADFLVSQRPDYFLLPAGNETGFFGWTDKAVKATSPAEGTFAGKPVIALIGPKCFSACDTFSAALKANGLAKFLGENTGGGTGTPLVFELPVSGFKFRYSVVRGKTAGGEWIEGKGTAPDVLQEYALDDLTKEPYADSQTLKAMELLRAQTGRDTGRPSGGGSGEGTGVLMSGRPATDDTMSALKLEFMSLQTSERFHE